MTCLFPLIFAICIAIEYENIDQQNEKQPEIEGNLFPDQGFPIQGDAIPPDNPDGMIPDAHPPQQGKDAKELDLAVPENPVEQAGWRRFRLERLQQRLREMQGNEFMGDEQHQERIMGEIRRLKNDLGLPILPEDEKIGRASCRERV
jgi:hypothetical protein